MALAAAELARLVSRGVPEGASRGEGAAPEGDRPKALPLGRGLLGQAPWAQAPPEQARPAQAPPEQGRPGQAPWEQGRPGQAPRGGDRRWLAAVDAALPDGGLPRGAVVEVASPLGLARGTSIAVAACAAAQRASVAWSPRAAWCAWLDPWGTLSAPGIAGGGLDRGGIDLERLLVVRPSTTMLARTATRVVGSGAFAVVVIDTVAPLCAADPGAGEEDGFAPVRLDRWPNVVRRLALAVEGTETIVLLLTDLLAARGLPLPVAMRVELQREAVATEPAGVVVGRSSLRIAKERHGRVAGPVVLAEDDGLAEGDGLAGGDGPGEAAHHDRRPGLHPALRSATSVG